MKPPTEGSAPLIVVMTGSLAILVALCGVAASEGSTLAEVLTESRKGYQEGAESRYPHKIQQPYPIIFEKKIPYEEEHYNSEADQGVYTSTGEGFVYGPQVVRVPLIYTVNSQPAHRIPYSFRVKKEKWPLPCSGDPDCINRGLDYPGKYKKKNTHKPVEGAEEVDLKNNQEEGSVQHTETFQTPILIAVEKPGYRYVKHLVGAGVLPKARQFHVLILEEDVTTVPSNTWELNDEETEVKDVETFTKSEDGTVYENKKEKQIEENKNIKSETINAPEPKISNEESSTDNEENL